MTTQNQLKSPLLSTRISNYLRLKKDGNLFKGNCPFCPSPKLTLVVDDHKNRYYCTEDGGTGNAILFLMRLKDLTYEEAINELSG